MEDVGPATFGLPAWVNRAAARIERGDPVARDAVDPAEGAADVDAALGASEAGEDAEAVADSAVLRLRRPAPVGSPVAGGERDKPVAM